MKTDLAVSEWCSYSGSNKKPADFDKFWLKAKEEVDSLSNDFQLIPYTFSSQVVDAYELNFTGVGGAKIVCQLIKPKQIDHPLPAIFQFHGYHTNVGDWNDKAALAAEGFIVVALDVRGQGGKSQDTSQTSGGTLKGHIIRGVEDGPEKLFYRSVYQDIYQLTKLVSNMPDVAEDRLISYGVSQGGALALVCAALTPTVKETYVQYPFLSDFREAYKLDVEQSAYEELAYWFRFRDPLHEHEEEFFSTLDYIDIQFLAERITSKVYWGMALEDRVCHPKTQFAVYNQLDTEKEIVYYPEYGHEYLPKFNDFMREWLLG